MIFSIINDKLKEDSFNDVLKQVFKHMNKLKKKLAEQLLLVVNAGKEFDEIGMFNTLKKVLVILRQVDLNKNLII